MLKPNAELFFRWWFGKALEVNPDFYIATWSHPSKKTLFHRTIDSANLAAMDLSGKENVYFAVCPLSSLPTNHAKGERGSLENYGALCGLWADIDIQDDVHKKQNLPKTIEEAQELIDDIKLEPSVITHSGHGVQVFWMLDKPWIFESNEDRQKAQAFTELWHKTIKYFAERRGWTVDSVFDLPRILRVPGTLNIKDPANPREVQFLDPAFVPSSSDVERFSLEKIECFTLAPELLISTKSSNRTKVVIDPVLPSSGTFGPDIPPMLAVMAENDPVFRRTLERQRKDFSDQSPSSYDFSLANQMAIAGCTDQEIADAIAWWRAKHCKDPKDTNKAFRRDYLQRTLSKIRTELGAQKSLEIASETPMELLEAEDQTIRDEAKNDVLQKVSEGLGIKIKGIIKLGVINARYTIVLDDGQEVPIGGLAQLLNQDAVRVCLGDATGILIRIAKKTEWQNIVQRLLKIVTHVSNLESDITSQLVQWINCYLSGDGIPNEDHGIDVIQNAHKRGLPYIEEDQYYLSGISLLKHIRINYDDKTNRGDVWEALRSDGWKTCQKNKNVNGKQVNKSLWCKKAPSSTWAKSYNPDDLGAGCSDKED